MREHRCIEQAAMGRSWSTHGTAELSAATANSPWCGAGPEVSGTQMYRQLRRSQSSSKRCCGIASSLQEAAAVLSQEVGAELERGARAPEKYWTTCFMTLQCSPAHHVASASRASIKPNDPSFTETGKRLLSQLLQLVSGRMNVGRGIY